ncbi:hypothetical protein HSRCO_0510 [Halanaeroarchaeum sp. HSR-CO]|nr:hypothetical protein HSRCO_0510 [Halanaeroarchaeum sp. HSR-CO]
MKLKTIHRVGNSRILYKFFRHDLCVVVDLGCRPSRDSASLRTHRGPRRDE